MSGPYQFPVRSAIDRARVIMGYLPAALRDGCRNCMHGATIGPDQASRHAWALRCEKGGFGVWPNDWCKEHERKTQ